MHSKSHSVKSKKQKLREKKQEKYYLPKKQIQIIDESSSSSSVVQIKDSKKGRASQKNYDRRDNYEYKSQPKYNNFNYQRYQRISGPIKSSYKAPILEVQECFNGISQARDDNRTISYKKVGGNSQKTVCQNYLKSRLVKISEQTNTTKNPIVQIEQKNEPEVKEDQEKKQTIQFRRVPRYFDDEAQILSNSGSDAEEDQGNKKKNFKCFRCGQKGHIARLCNQAQILKCMYCLGSHHHTDCDDQLCHKCNQKGHIKQNCKSDKIQCRKCRNHGHIAKNCGKVMMMNFSSNRQKQIRQNYQREDLEKLKCLKCNGYKECKGHFNCHQYHKKTPKIYQQSYARMG